MTKVIGMLVALAMFCAMPALAFAQNGDGGEASNNEQNANIDQDGTAGDGGDGGDAAGGGDGSGGDAQGGDGGDGGSVGNQAAICQQNAGDDANCSIDQSQTVGGDTFVNGGGGGGDVSGEDFDNDEDNVGGGDFDNDDDDVTFDNEGVGGGSVESVTLARTGFDAWVLALVGGISLVGGLGLLAAQRRGRLNA